MSFSEYEDKIRESKKILPDMFSPYCDWINVKSSVDKDVTFAVRVLKPERPSYILASTHGWHMSIPKFVSMQQSKSQYLHIQVDMRGRAFSTGSPDCNGYELYDVFDAIEYVKANYSEYLCSTETIYFESGSGGGGNALAIAGKFPDLFSAVNALCPISDYADWYRTDKTGEFRDELEVWIGGTPQNNLDAYNSRGGITVLPNILAPIFIAHGDLDVRVPAYLSQKYVEAAAALNKQHLISYYEIKGVGGNEHYQNITQAQEERLNEYRHQNLKNNTKPVNLPPEGRLVVAGYVRTKHFEIRLDSIDKTATFAYSLPDKKAHPVTEGELNYTLKWF